VSAGCGFYTEGEEKQEQKFDAAVVTLFRIRKCFQKASRNFNNYFSL
jgi:hypothetical protein